MHGSTAFSCGSLINSSVHATTRRPWPRSFAIAAVAWARECAVHASAGEVYLLAHPCLTLQHPKRC